MAAHLADEGDRAKLENFFWQLVPTLRAPPALVRSAGGHFMDKPDNVISLINLATVRSLEAQWGVEIDPLRFRANIYIDGAEPWEEFNWVGGEIRIGDTVFAVDRKNGRCGATNVNPATGRRDLDIPGSLRAAFGHKNLGVYLDRARWRRDRRRRPGPGAALDAGQSGRPGSGAGDESAATPFHVPRLLFHLRRGQRPAAAIDPAGHAVRGYSGELALSRLRHGEDDLPALRGKGRGGVGDCAVTRAVARGDNRSGPIGPPPNEKAP